MCVSFFNYTKYQRPRFSSWFFLPPTPTPLAICGETSLSMVSPRRTALLFAGCLWPKSLNPLRWDGQRPVLIHWKIIPVATLHQHWSCPLLVTCGFSFRNCKAYANCSGRFSAKMHLFANISQCFPKDLSLEGTSISLLSCSTNV